jgi:hypothetical protein
MWPLEFGHLRVCTSSCLGPQSFLCSSIIYHSYNQNVNNILLDKNLRANIRCRHIKAYGWWHSTVTCTSQSICIQVGTIFSREISDKNDIYNFCVILFKHHDRMRLDRPSHRYLWRSRMWYVLSCMQLEVCKRSMNPTIIHTGKAIYKWGGGDCPLHPTHPHHH